MFTQEELDLLNICVNNTRTMMLDRLRVDPKEIEKLDALKRKIAEHIKF